MSGPPEVSVVIPTRNRWPMLRHALAGALGQEDVDLEVVVVDDGSSDETPRRLAELADERLRVLRQETTEGVARARNRGIAAARGDWVAFLDDDDLWSPRKLRAQLDAAKAAGAEFVYSRAVLLDERKRVLEALPLPEPADLVAQLLWRCVIPAGCSNVAARTSVVRRLGGLDSALSHLDDWDLWIRLAANARAAAVDDVLVGYVHHSQNRVVVDNRGLLEELDYLTVKHRPLSEAHGVEFDRLGFSRSLAWAHRRAGRRLHAGLVYLRGAWAYRSLGNVPRAIGAVAGEGMMRGYGPGIDLPEPAWLDLYRCGPPRGDDARG